MSKSNRVTLFSNGMGHFTRHYEVKASVPERISLPFNKNHISDVATSLNTFRAEGGTVRYSVPPSFTPTNAHSSSLQIDPKNAMCSLMEKLSGAEAKISFVNTSKAPEDVRIIGIDSLELMGVHGETVKQDALSVLDSSGWTKRYRMNDITGVRFTNESVQAEVDKALRQNYQKIKPESTFLDLVLECDEDSLAAVTYTIPVAAWKMRYSIQQYDESKFYLEGAVVVDNNTDEDWDNFVVSVVTGDPISFMTDIAEIKTPQRRMINLVNTNAVGNVHVENGYMNESALESVRSPIRSASADMSRSVINAASFGLAAKQDVSESSGYNIEDMASGSGVETKEVGDFCIFTSKTPISIASKKSAVVPMFTVPLTTAGVVLLYKESNHTRRAFRAVKFKNETDHTLGKGKVVLYNDGLLSGECILETAKPNENRMLPHCLENGVRIIREDSDNDQILTSIKISDSIAVREWVQLASTKYLIENKKKESFQIAMEVPSLLNNMDAEFCFDGVKVEEIEKLQSGRRLYFTLAPNEKLKLLINEKLVTDQKANIGNNFQWLRSNIISVGNDLMEHEGVKKCIEIQTNLDELQNTLKELHDRQKKLDQQAERIRRNINSAVSANTSINDWLSDLDKFEKECRSIEDIQVPETERLLRENQKELTQALQNLSASWTLKQVQTV